MRDVDQAELAALEDRARVALAALVRCLYQLDDDGRPSRPSDLVDALRTERRDLYDALNALESPRWRSLVKVLSDER